MGKARKKAYSFKAGDRVYWNDPDEGTCSGPGKVVEVKSEGDVIDPDTIICVEKDDGGEVECFPRELRKYA